MSVLTPLPNRRRSILASTTSSVSDEASVLSPASAARGPPVLPNDGSSVLDYRRSRRSGNILAAIQSPSAETRQAAKPQLSDADVIDHYQNCIQLISQNKVSAKNAFGLHLIDMMDQVLSTGNRDGFFQMAGCTLHAGAKIYEYRVDGLHSDTYKVANVLGSRSGDAGNPENDDPNNDGDDDLEAHVPAALKKKRQKNFKCIVKELNKIIKPVKYNIDHDALRQKAANLIDASKSSDLLTIHLPQIEDERREKLVIDGVEPISYRIKRSETEKEIPNISTEILQLPRLDSLRQKLICPDLEQLLFSDDRNNSMDASRDLENSRMDKFLQDVDQNLAFDTEAPVAEQDCLMFRQELTGFDDSLCDNIPPAEMSLLAPNDSALPGDVSAMSNAMYRSEFDLGGNSNFEMLQDSLENLLKHVQPGEYSYFSESVLSALRPKAPAKTAAALEAARGKPVKKRVKLTPDTIKLDYDVDFIVKSCKSRAATTLTEVKSEAKRKTCVSFSRSQYLRCSLTSYFELDVLKSISSAGKNPEEVKIEEEYDYDNNNDVNNFCQTGLGRPGDYTDDDEDVADFGHDIDDMGDIDDQPADNNLIDAPVCPEQHKIGYAKRAKNVDVRKVKRSMYKNLCEDVKKHPSLTELYRNAHSTLPSKVVRDLSIQVAFVTLLDLTNEQKLELKQLVHGEDFSVSLPTDFKRIDDNHEVDMES